MSWLAPAWDTWRAGGPLLAPLALACAGIWAWFLHLRRHYLGLLRSSDPLMHRLEGIGPAAGVPGLERALAETPGPFSAQLRSALGEIRGGAGPDAVFGRTERLCREAWRRDLLILAALTAAAPLLGLLGTVTGMVDTFDAVAAASGQTGARVAGGISTALITTQFGLVIALPGLFGAARLERLIRALEVRLAECRALVLAFAPAAPEARP